MLVKNSPPAIWAILGAMLSVGIAVALALIGVLALFYRYIALPATYGFDAALQAHVHAYATPWLTHVMFALTDTGKVYTVAPMIVLVVALLCLRRRWLAALGIALSEIASNYLDQIIKAIVHRHRPTLIWALAHEKDFSFPSAHAMMGIISFGTVAFLLWQRYPHPAVRTLVVIAASCLIFGIGLSRIYIGVHYPTDVLGGWLAGGIWLTALIIGMRWMQRLRAI